MDHFILGPFFSLGLLQKKSKQLGRGVEDIVFWKYSWNLKSKRKEAINQHLKEFLQNCDTPWNIPWSKKTNKGHGSSICVHMSFFVNTPDHCKFHFFFSLTDCWLLEFPMLFLQLPWKFYVLPTLPAPLGF